MQISWIEPEELRLLASKLLEPQRSDVPPITWELHTLPDFSPVMPGGMMDTLRDLKPARPAPPMSVPFAPPALGPDIANIREKLRAIRDRAQDAGLLRPAAPPTLPEPQEALAPAPVAEAIPGPTVEVVADAPALVEKEAPPASIQEPEPEPVVHVQEPVVAVPATVPAAALPSTSFLPLEGTISERLDAFARWAIQITAAREFILVDDHGDSLWGAPSRNDLVVSTMLALSASLRSNANEINSLTTVVRTKANAEHDVAIMPCATHYGMVSLAIVTRQIISDEIVACLREALIQTIDGARAG